MRDTGGSRELAGSQASSVISKIAQGQKAVEQGTPSLLAFCMCG